MSDADTFDYVIVGSGAAGSVLANRLSADPNVTVCVLEAGPPDRNPFIHIPAGFLKTLANPDVTWQFKTEPLEMTGGRRISTVQGRTLGGSSSVNGMIYNRGQPADLDNWAQRGNRGWGYADCLPYYRRSENRIGVSDDLPREECGRHPDHRHGLDPSAVRSLHQGLQRDRDSALPGLQFRRTRRVSGISSGRSKRAGGFHAARAFLKPALSRPNLEVRTNARASRILFEGKRAVGVRYVAASARHRRRRSARGGR